MTMRPIFSPSARKSEVSPAAVGGAAATGSPATCLLLFSAIGEEVGLLVATTRPGCELTAATSVPVSADFDTVVFGTGFCAVGLEETTTRGAATAVGLPCFGPRPNVALPSVTDIGGKLETDWLSGLAGAAEGTSG